MSTKTIKHWAILLIALSAFFVSCHDENLLVDEDYVSDVEAATRAYYDNELVWDNVDYLEYKLGNTTSVLSVPWAPGNSHALGIPEHWFDSNYRNSSASKRVYSTYNGWELVYSNLANPAQSNKYFALYNKYTGILRLFFYEISSSSGIGSSITYEGIRVTGSKLLNFTFENPQPMDVSYSSTSYVFLPQCDFPSVAVGDEISLTGEPYKPNNWYGLEVECAYDSNAASNSTLNLYVWSANVTTTQTEGTSMGNITGSISTTYTNTPSWNFNINYTDKKSTVIQSLVNSSAIIGGEIKEGVENNDSKLTQLWNSLVSKMPSLLTDGIEAGVQTLLTGGASTLVNLGGRLLNSALGMGSTQTMTSLSEVKLNTAAEIGLESVSTTQYAGWGTVLNIPLAGHDSSSPLYNQELGVWNLATAPKVYVDQFSICYYNSFFGNATVTPMSINPDTAPVEWETRYDLRLQPISIVLNPAISGLFTLQNVTQDLVFTDGLEDVSSSSSAYGLNNGTIVYAANNSSIVNLKETMPDINLNGFNPDTSFVPLWNAKVANVGASMYCRVAFELKHKTTSQIIGFSKYFKVNALKGTHTHSDNY